MTAGEPKPEPDSSELLDYAIEEAELVSAAASGSNTTDSDDIVNDVELVDAPLQSNLEYEDQSEPNSTEESSTDFVKVEIVEEDESEPEIADTQTVSTNNSTNPIAVTPVQTRSWIFRLGSFLNRTSGTLFGIASLVFLLAVLANIPLLQFLSFGYLLEVTGRISRGQKFRQSFIGLRKATHIGGILLGTWLLIIPIRLLSTFWLEAYLIDPTSVQTSGLRIGLWIVTVLTVAHVVAAWLCGGKLRYFFWPVIAPVSMMIWLVRRSKLTRKLLSITLGWISPKLVSDICSAQPLTDWFLPLILWNQISQKDLYGRCRDAVWDFLVGLNLPYFFMHGLKGFVGTFLWLVIPTLLLMGASIFEGGAAAVCGILGVLIAIPVFALLPFMQAHFAHDGKLRRFIEPWKVFKNFAAAPMAHVFALFMTLVFALPLFLLKIEEIPGELLWTLSLVFVIFAWPTKMLIGWAYGRGIKKEHLETKGRWWIRYPILLVAAPVSFSFIVIFFVTRYTSWNGAKSLIENHVFLLPAPFWL